MSRERGFSSPFLLGFDVFEEALERIAKSSGDGYPPYNVESLGPDRLRITVAVAGFDESELTVTLENSELSIAGRQADEAAERVFLHRGIAARAFQRRFVLADGMEVAGAALDKGLLHIDLVRPQGRETSRSIPIERRG
jgi:HSP20 family molecular chaperone IbpA